MSLKKHMLSAHLDKFRSTMEVYSEEQRKSFYRDVMDFGRRYQGQNKETIAGV